MKWVLGVIALLAVIAVVLFFVPFNLDASPLPSITTRWTAPGDDGNIGTATLYDMRWSASKPDTTSAAAMTAWWDAATPVPGMPTPAIAGTPQSTTVAPTGGFAEGNTYYFVIRTQDDAGNWSLYSNVAWRFVPDLTPPAPIIDLVAE